MMALWDCRAVQKYCRAVPNPVVSPNPGVFLYIKQGVPRNLVPTSLVTAWDSSQSLFDYVYHLSFPVVGVHRGVKVVLLINCVIFKLENCPLSLYNKL